MYKLATTSEEKQKAKNKFCKFSGFINMDGLRIAVRKQPLLPPFSANATLLVTREITSWMRLFETIDPERPNLESPTKSLCFFGIFGPDTRSESTVCIVGPSEHFLLCLP
jgi:hypothetical protein